MLSEQLPGNGNSCDFRIVSWHDPLLLICELVERYLLMISCWLKISYFVSIWERREKIVIHIQIYFTQKCEKGEYKPVRWEQVKCKLTAEGKARLYEPPTRQPRMESLPETQVTILASALSVVTWRADKNTLWAKWRCCTAITFIATAAQALWWWQPCCLAASESCFTLL